MSPSLFVRQQLLYNRVALLLGLNPGDFARETRNSEIGPMPVIAQLLGRGLLLRDLTKTIDITENNNTITTKP